MERIKNNPISTFLGFAMIVFAAVLLFVPTLYDMPLYGIGVIGVIGILLLFAKDQLVDILTGGLSRLIQDAAQKVKK
ncbi:hypothetical protein SAMN05216480_12314 [Pustulibacterium marinum]|uniref:Uncharacterized protein n=1 Tax=Pustulibacterium marinum TaxID=1224947 RepID=A0A1I7IVX6_9FLAO|nr:hypothetical protein [Pustulibacterium marinum]SFU77083.1 hypothetical protein SAMN05216480_12314 [Pustulibacterium marinum]